MEKGSSCSIGIISLKRGLLGNYQKVGEGVEISRNSWHRHSPLYVTLLCLTEYISCIGVKILVLQWSKENSGTPGLICDAVFLWSSQSQSGCLTIVYLSKRSSKASLPNTRCFWNKHRDKHDNKNGDCYCISPSILDLACSVSLCCSFCGILLIKRSEPIWLKIVSAPGIWDV